MKFKPLQTILFTFVFLAKLYAQQPQQTIKATVIDITDGRTMIVETADKNRFMIRLQRIEAPDPGTDWGKTGSAHLRALVFGKSIEFQVTTVEQSVNVGRVFFNDVDLAMQLLRDGAVWYLAPDQDSHLPWIERSRYLEMETAAKNEKRGVWSQTAVKPSWVVQAEKEAERRRAEELASQTEDSRRALERQRRRERQNAETKSVLWADMPADLASSSAATSQSTVAPRKMISILQLNSDQQSFMDAPLLYDAVFIEVSTLYFGVYSGIGEKNFYAFEISDGSGSTLAYMRRGEQAEKLRSQLLQPGARVRGRASVTLLIRSDLQDGSSSIYPEIIGFGTAAAEK